MLATFLDWLGHGGLLAAFAAAALLSLMIATWWGEMAGIRPHRDKSGLGGFAFLYLFFGLRWLLLAPLVVVGAAEMLPGSTLWWLLGHALLGFAGTRLFERGLAIVREDRVVPLWIGLTGALLVPAPALLLGCHVVAFACFQQPLVAWPVLLALHTWGFWQRRRELFRPEPPPPPSEVVDTDRGGR